MARARTITKLPLDTWARFMGINPVHFNQCYIPGLESAICSAGWFSEDWQDSQRVSREQLAATIRQAEGMVEAFLGYRLMPCWEEDEYHGLGRPYRPEFFNLGGTDVRGRRVAARLDWGYFISGGVEAKDLLDDAVPIVWTDAEGGDSRKDTGTAIAVVPAGTEACEIEAYYPGKAGNDDWRIRPISVVVVGAAATITFKRELAVLEDLLLDPDARGVDYTNDANFLDEVDVYRRYNDPSQQATLLWESCGCADGCVSCGFNAQTACIRLRGDDRQSHVSYYPATWDVDDESFTYEACAAPGEPDAARFWYRSGFKSRDVSCDQHDMDTELQWPVAILAASLLDRKVCDCRGINDGIERWQTDLATVKSSVSTVLLKVPDDIMRCPFGTRVGAVEAWRRLNGLGTASVQKGRIGRAILT